MSKDMQNVEFNSIGNGLQVERGGGRWKSGIIKNFAVLTMDVEAKGHDLWVDKEFGEEVAEALKVKSGIKSRLTHVRGDGITAGLGRVMFSKIEEGKVYGDLHFWASSHKSPSGNLADFVMTKAEEDPEAFGSSIGFSRDIEREDWSEEKPRVRLSELKYVDIVDSPATNPEGLFDNSEDDVVSEAIALLADKGYEVMKLNFEDGVKKDEVVEEVVMDEGQEDCNCPDDCEDCEKVKEEKEYSEEEKEETLSEVEKEPEAEPQSDEKTDFMQRLKQYTSMFGAEEGLRLFEEGVDIAEAQSQFIAKQKAEIKELKMKLNVEMSSSESVGQAGEAKHKGLASKIKTK